MCVCVCVKTSFHRTFAIFFPVIEQPTDRSLESVLCLRPEIGTSSCPSRIEKSPYRLSNRLFQIRHLKTMTLGD